MGAGNDEKEHPGLGWKGYALSLDGLEPAIFPELRKDFHIPTKAQLKAKSLPEAVKLSDVSDDSWPDESIYLCGNSLGLQPKITAVRLKQYFETWQTQGVYGHFKPLADSPLPTWLDADIRASESIAPIVGASPSEVAVMETLTANLHLLMSAFYKPDINGRHKIVIESQAFPSDHFAAESQILHHNLDPAKSLITITASNPSIALTTSEILAVIAEHASTTALLLLPGIQYYTGALLEIRTITEFAHSHGIFVIFDLAHAVGNVPLQLHDWDVDAAVWCSYKYLNAGPGSAGGLFVHERNATVSVSETGKKLFPNRLSGWWGSDKSSRFAMDNKFVPTPGAAGFQLSNPSIFDLTSICASLEMFAKAGGMAPLRARSLRLTGYLERLLQQTDAFQAGKFSILTPSDPEQRGAQLSLKLDPDSLDDIMRRLEENGVVVDERRPNVIRVAPAPLYNDHADCWHFSIALDAAFRSANL